MPKDLLRCQTHQRRVDQQRRQEGQTKNAQGALAQRGTQHCEDGCNSNDDGASEGCDPPQIERARGAAVQQGLQTAPLVGTTPIRGKLVVAHVESQEPQRVEGDIDEAEGVVFSVFGPDGFSEDMSGIFEASLEFTNEKRQI